MCSQAFFVFVFPQPFFHLNVVFPRRGALLTRIDLQQSPEPWLVDMGLSRIRSSKGILPAWAEQRTYRSLQWPDGIPPEPDLESTFGEMREGPDRDAAPPEPDMEMDCADLDLIEAQLFHSAQFGSQAYGD